MKKQQWSKENFQGWKNIFIYRKCFRQNKNKDGYKEEAEGKLVHLCVLCFLLCTYRSCFAYVGTLKDIKEKIFYNFKANLHDCQGQTLLSAAKSYSVEHFVSNYCTNCFKKILSNSTTKYKLSMSFFNPPSLQYKYKSADLEEDHLFVVAFRTAFFSESVLFECQR